MMHLGSTSECSTVGISYLYCTCTRYMHVLYSGVATYVIELLVVLNCKSVTLHGLATVKTDH